MSVLWLLGSRFFEATISLITRNDGSRLISRAAVNQSVSPRAGDLELSWNKSEMNWHTRPLSYRLPFPTSKFHSDSYPVAINWLLQETALWPVGLNEMNRLFQVLVASVHDFHSAHTILSAPVRSVENLSSGQHCTLLTAPKVSKVVSANLPEVNEMSSRTTDRWLSSRKFVGHCADTIKFLCITCPN